jgi:predicted DNA binding CopG/RHH family protein
MRNPKRKAIPKFRSEREERNFWARHDSTPYVDWSHSRRVIFPNLKPSLRTISLRLPESVIARLKVLAHKRDIPYQSLLKVLLTQRLEQEEATQT